MKNDIEGRGRFERRVPIGERLMQIGLLKNDIRLEPESCPVFERCLDSRSAHIDSSTVAAGQRNHESEQPAGSAAEIQNPACACDLQPGDIAFEVLLPDPGVLPDVVAISLAPDLPHQRRIEIPIETVVACR